MAKSKNKSQNSAAVPLILIFGLVIIGILIFKSCASSGDPSSNSTSSSEFSNVAIVVGDHQNSPAVKLPESLVSKVQEVITANKLDSINIINATKTPKVSPYNLGIKWKNPNKDALNKDIKNALESLSGGLNNFKIDSDGADYLNAIKDASYYMKNSGNDSNKSGKQLIIVIGSGLSDSGVLNFADGDLLSRDNNEIIDNISNKLSSDDLKGTKIVWVNVGETYAPQLPLSSDLKTKVQDIYKGIFEKMGVLVNDLNFEVNNYKFQSVNNTVNGKTYYVKPTNIPSDKIDWADLNMPFDDAILGGFVTNSSDFKNPEQARTALQSLFEILKKSTQKINIEGSQMKEKGKAAVSDGEVAQMRADGVKNLLVSMGIDSSRISTNNIGSSHATKDADEEDKKVVITSVK